MSIQIPELAMKVVEVLRRDVPKPKELPIFIDNDDGILRFFTKNNYWGILTYYCPMGLHPKAVRKLPSSKLDFPIDDLILEEILAFAKWWDAQTDAQAAVDAVWGKDEHTNT